jgi:catechol 2,3-dioxygenase-like lactoylglutathione lyase family enzyme
VPVEVVGIDHAFVAFRDLRRSEEFYDRVMRVLGFRKGEQPIGGDPHVVSYNRQFVYALRLAREDTPDHHPYAPGLHHLCFGVVDEEAVDRAKEELRELGVGVTLLRDLLRGPARAGAGGDELQGAATQDHVRLGGSERPLDPPRTQARGYLDPTPG